VDHQKRLALPILIPHKNKNVVQNSMPSNKMEQLIWKSDPIMVPVCPNTDPINILAADASDLYYALKRRGRILKFPPETYPPH
jgi:hypothetical protein